MAFVRAASAVVLQKTRPAAQSNQSSGSFSPITSNLYFALFDADQAEKMAQHTLKVKFVVVPMTAMCRYIQEGNLAEYFTPSSLSELYRFDVMANQIKRRNADQKLVFAAGRKIQVQKRAIFLIGCHVIMSHGFDAESTFSFFKHSKELFARGESGQVNILDCWYALDRAKSIGWIDFQEFFDIESDKEADTLTLDMEEFIHYSSPINGEVITLIPGQIILFEEPDDEIVKAAGARNFFDANGRRYFNSVFYADLLAHLGAKLVVCLDDARPASLAKAQCATFSAAGICCCLLEDLCSGGAGRFSLQTLDRFITLVTSCPGLVAVQCCRGTFASSTACTHLAALMLRQQSFLSTAHAVAWMQMTHPGRLTEAIDLAQLERQLSQQLTRKVWRERSFSVSLHTVPFAGANELLEETDLMIEPTSPAASLQGLESPREGVSPSSTLSPPAHAPVSPSGAARPWHSPLRSFSVSSPSLSVPPLAALGSETDE